MHVKKVRFEWDEKKDEENQKKHEVSFAKAQRVFFDPQRIIAEDVTHSSDENRFYCIGRIEDGILTVRFTFRGIVIRIYGAGYWRKGKKLYEDQNKIHRRTYGESAHPGRLPSAAGSTCIEGRQYEGHNLPQ
jgi:uncharacterized protein